MAGKRGGGLALACAAGFAALTASPALAALPKRAVPVVPADPAATLTAARQRLAAGDCRGVLGLIDPLVARRPDAADPTRVAAQLVRLPCLATLHRDAEAMAVVAELRRTAPDNPVVRAFAVGLDAQAGRTAQAADAMATLADEGSPALRLIPSTVWRVVSQRLRQAGDEARRDRLALSLARARWVPADDPDVAQALAFEAIGAALDAHDNDEATAFLVRIRQPDALVAMVTSRRYAALWPAIERRLGPASGLAVDRYARTALDTFASTPDDVAARLDAAHAFAYLGRADDVAATAAPVAVTPGIDEDRVTIVLLHAQALSSRGDWAGATARLQPFATSDLVRAPAAASALISLAELDHEQHRYAEELALARATIARGADALSSFGIAWLRRNEACALAGLGRDAEARAAGDTLRAKSADNQAAAIEGLLCLHRDDEAAALAVSTLAARDGADRLADQFQPAGALFMAEPSTLRSSWERLLARADVRAAFDRAARILPRSLWPTRDRALPAPAVAADDPDAT